MYFMLFKCSWKRCLVEGKESKINCERTVMILFLEVHKQNYPLFWNTNVMQISLCLTVNNEQPGHITHWNFIDVNGFCCPGRNTNSKEFIFGASLLWATHSPCLWWEWCVGPRKLLHLSLAWIFHYCHTSAFWGVLNWFRIVFPFTLGVFCEQMVKHLEYFLK